MIQTLKSGQGESKLSPTKTMHDHNGLSRASSDAHWEPIKSSDVFALGSLLLEVVCGRRPIDRKASPEELILVNWVWDRWEEGAILVVVDKRLSREYDEIEAILVLKLGLICSNNVPRARPSMRLVVRYLEVTRSHMPELLMLTDGGGGGGDEFEDYLHSSETSSIFEIVMDEDVKIEIELLIFPTVVMEEWP